MRAIAIDGFGGREKLRLMDPPEPEAGLEDVLVRVRAAGVGPWDVKTREGMFGERSFPLVLGSEGSGVVEGAGESVSGLSVGDEVFVHGGGCYAELTAVRAGSVARKPASLSFEEAAGVPIAGVTAYRGLAEEIGVKAGQTVLITGAAGGVGTMAVQVANVLGARVIGTASPRNHDYVRSLGAYEVIDYHEGDWAARARELSSGGVHAVLDCVGGETFHESFEAVRDGGRIVSIVAFGEQIEPGRNITYGAFSARGASREKLEWLAARFDSGQLRVEISEVLPLEEAAKAHEEIESGHTRGKVVLTL